MIYVELNKLDLALLAILGALILFVAWDLAVDIVTSIKDKKRRKKA